MSRRPSLTSLRQGSQAPPAPKHPAQRFARVQNRARLRSRSAAALSCRMPSAGGRYTGRVCSFSYSFSLKTCCMICEGIFDRPLYTHDAFLSEKFACARINRQYAQADVQFRLKNCTPAQVRCTKKARFFIVEKPGIRISMLLRQDDRNGTLFLGYRAVCCARSGGSASMHPEGFARGGCPATTA